MFKTFFDKRKAKKAESAWNNSQLGKALAAHTIKYFGSGVLSGMSEEVQQKIISDLYHKIRTILASENPLLKLREEISSYVYLLSSLQVIAMDEVEKHQYYADCAYVSGELHQHARLCSAHNKELSELLWKYPNITDNEIIGFCNSRRMVYLYFVNGLNCLREELDDFDQTKDWLLAFAKAMLICQEDTYRRHLNLPLLLPNTLDGLIFSSFLSFVQSGESNPYFAWHSKYGDKVSLN